MIVTVQPRSFHRGPGLSLCEEGPGLYNRSLAYPLFLVALFTVVLIAFWPYLRVIR